MSPKDSALLHSAFGCWRWVTKPIDLPNALFKREVPRDYLRVLRAGAFGLVCITHSTILANNPAFSSGMPFFAYGAAHPGMWVFFTLSGYLISKLFYRGRYQLSPDGLTSYLSARVRRILPLYLVSQAFIVGFYFVVFSENRFDLRHTISSLFFYSQSSVYIGALWSIVTEVQFYLLAPALLALMSTRPRLLFPSFILAVGLYRFVIWQQLPQDHATWFKFTYSPLVGNLDCFIIGIGVNLLPARLFERINVSWITFVASVVSAYLLFSAIDYNGIQLQGRLGQFFVVLAPTLVSLLVGLGIAALELSRFDAKTDRFLESGTLNVLSTLTYGLYVWHSPLIDLANRFYKSTTAPEVVIVRSVWILAITFLLALATYKLFESRFLVKRARRESRKPQASYDKSTELATR